MLPLRNLQNSPRNSRVVPQMARKLLMAVFIVFLIGETTSQTSFVSLNSDLPSQSNLNANRGSKSNNASGNNKPLTFSFGGRTFRIVQKKKQAKPVQQQKPIQKPQIKPVKIKPVEIKAPKIKPVEIKVPKIRPMLNPRPSIFRPLVKPVQPFVKIEKPVVKEPKVEKVKVEEVKQEPIKQEPIKKEPVKEEPVIEETNVEIIDRVPLNGSKPMIFEEKEEIIVESPVEKIEESEVQESEDFDLQPEVTSTPEPVEPIVKIEEPVVEEPLVEVESVIQEEETEEPRTDLDLVEEKVEVKVEEKVKPVVEEAESTGSTSVESKLADELINMNDDFNFEKMMSNLDNLENIIKEDVVKGEQREEAQIEKPISKDEVSETITVVETPESETNLEAEPEIDIKEQNEDLEREELRKSVQAIQDSEESIISLDNSLPEVSEKEDKSLDLRSKEMPISLTQNLNDTLKDGSPSLLNMFNELMSDEIDIQTHKPTEAEAVPEPVQKVAQPVAQEAPPTASESVSVDNTESAPENLQEKPSEPTAPKAQVNNDQKSSSQTSTKQEKKEKKPTFKLKPAEFLSQPLAKAPAPPKPQARPVQQVQRQPAAPASNLTPGQKLIKKQAEQAEQDPKGPAAPQIPEALKVTLTRVN